MNRLVKIPIEWRQAIKLTRGQKLEEPYRNTLSLAMNGVQVDLLDLNIAIHAGMATAATRAATSPMRRQMAATIFELAQYVNSLLDGAAPERQKPRQPVEYDPSELEEWLSA